MEGGLCTKTGLFPAHPFAAGAAKQTRSIARCSRLGELDNPADAFKE